jgi:hypothetical protein
MIIKNQSFQSQDKYLIIYIWCAFYSWVLFKFPCFSKKSYDRKVLCIKRDLPCEFCSNCTVTFILFWNTYFQFVNIHTYDLLLSLSRPSLFHFMPLHSLLALINLHPTLQTLNALLPFHSMHFHHIYPRNCTLSPHSSWLSSN